MKTETLTIAVDNNLQRTPPPKWRGTGGASEAVTVAFAAEHKVDTFALTGAGFEFSEENCPGHVAAARDPKVCRRCGVHVDSFRPDEQGP